MSILRLATFEDYDQILLLKIAIHQKHVMAEPKFYKNSLDVMTKDFFIGEIKKNQILVLEDSKQIIGYAFISEMNVKDNPIIRDQKIFLIEDFCISESQRRKGFGREFFKELEKYALERGCTSVELNVWDFNKEAQMFYNEMGMRRTRIRMIKEI